MWHDRPRIVARETGLTLDIGVLGVGLDGKIEFSSRQRVKFGVITPDLCRICQNFHTKIPSFGSFGEMGGQNWQKNEVKRRK